MELSSSKDISFLDDDFSGVALIKRTPPRVVCEVMNAKLQLPMSLDDYAALEEHLIEVVTLLGKKGWDHVGPGFCL